MGFGGEDDIMPPTILHQSTANDAFTLTTGIAVARVNQVDAQHPTAGRRMAVASASGIGLAKLSVPNASGATLTPVRPKLR